MKELSNKVENEGVSAEGILSADGFNELAKELENVMTSQGFALTSADLKLLVKSIANYAAGGDLYTDSGSADSYVLSVIDDVQAPDPFRKGMQVRFIPESTNTGGPATIDVPGLGVKNIKSSLGGDPAAGTIPAGQFKTLTFNSVDFIDDAISDDPDLNDPAVAASTVATAILSARIFGQFTQIFRGSISDSVPALLGSADGGVENFRKWLVVADTQAGSTSLDSLTVGSISTRVSSGYNGGSVNFSRSADAAAAPTLGSSSSGLLITGGSIMAVITVGDLSDVHVTGYHFDIPAERNINAAKLALSNISLNDELGMTVSDDIFLYGLQTSQSTHIIIYDMG